MADLDQSFNVLVGGQARSLEIAGPGEYLIDISIERTSVSEGSPELHAIVRSLPAISGSYPAFNEEGSICDYSNFDLGSKAFVNLDYPFNELEIKKGTRTYGKIQVSNLSKLVLITQIAADLSGDLGSVSGVGTFNLFFKATKLDN